MKANELRSGNYVEKTIYSLPPKSLIERVDAFYISLIERGDANCEPILLTEEWLAKFGFPCVWSGQGDGSTYEKGVIHIHRHHEKDSTFRFYWQYSRTGSTKWEHIGSPSSELKYVHQLQNLYFCLTGEELTIK